MTRRSLTTAILAGLTAAACEDRAQSASFLVLVSPDPLEAQLEVLPPAQTQRFRVRFDITLAEVSGVGARVQSIDTSVRDPGTQRVLASYDISPQALVSQTGTDHVAGNGRLTVGAILFFSPAPSPPALTVTARLLDDLGNSVATPTVQVPIRLP